MELSVLLNCNLDWVKNGERKSVCLFWKADSLRAINKLGLTLPDPASLLKPHFPRPQSPKQLPFLRKKIRSPLFFCHLKTSPCFVAFLLSLLSAKLPYKIVLENPRFISLKFSENSFALIRTKILKNIKKWWSLHIWSIFSKHLYNKNNDNNG